MPDLNKELGPFFRLFRPHYRHMALGALLGLTAIAASVGLLALAGWFLTATAITGLTAASAQVFNFFFPSIGVRLFAFTRTLARYGERVISHDATFRLLESLRVWFYRYLEPLAPACLMRYRSGDILNRLVADIDTLDNLYVRVLSPAVTAVATTFLLLGFLWFFDPVIALTGALFLGGGGFLVPAAAAALGADTGRRMGQQGADLRTRIVEALQGLPELLVYGARVSHIDRIDRDSRALMASQRRMSHITGLSNGLVTLVSGLAVLVVLYLGIDRLDMGGLGGANLALVALAVMAAFEAVWPLPLAFQYLGRTREAARRLLEIAHAEPVARFPDKTDQGPRRFDVRFEGIGFRYRSDGPPVLDAVDLHLAVGQRTAVLGETGSGKSTLVNLLVRFWDPDCGRVCIDGIDIRSLAESDLRRWFTVVSQQAHIFSASLRENLRMGRSGATDDDFRQVLDAVDLLAFVDGLPDGLDTWVGEGGSLLSGGQARRLAIARAFLHDGPIWVLDEPTEGLDRVTEQRVMQAIFERTRGKTLLLITHRMVGMAEMDAVVVLKSGRIVAHNAV